MNNLSKVATEKKGTWFAIVSGLLYGLLGYFGVNLLNHGFSAYNVSFWRFSISFLFLATIFIFNGAKSFGSRDQIIRCLVNGAIFYCAPSTLFFLASQYISTGQSMVIFFIYPAFVMLFNWMLDKKPLKADYFLSFILILLGLILLVDIKEIELDFIGIGLSLLSAISYAVYIISSKKVTLPALNSTMLVSLGCIITSFIFAMADHSLMWPSQGEQWFYILGLGIFCSALPILLLLEAMKYISSDKASLLSVLEPVFTVIFGVVLLAESLSLNAIFGILIILIGAMSVSVSWPKLFFNRRKPVL